MEFIKAKTILTKTKNPYSWFGVDYNVNLYRGCSHGCIYCDSRSECYNIDNFSKVMAKENALEILEKEMLKRRNKGLIGTGAMSDPYNPLNSQLKLTKGLLELAAKYHYGIVVYTKSAAILDDVYELLKVSLNAKVVILFTITTFDDELCKKIEPNVSVTSERLKAMETLSNFGFTIGVLLMPILPFINDTEENIKSIVSASAAAGAKFIYPYFGVTLRDRQREYYYEQVNKLFSGVKAKYERYYSYKYNCNSFNKGLYKTFINECNEYGLKHEMRDIIDIYKPTIKYDQISFDSYFD